MSEGLQWPGDGELSEAWLLELRGVLESASREPPPWLPQALPVSTVSSLLRAAHRVLHGEATMVEVRPQDVQDASVTIVGDLHGQLHDALRLFDLAGLPNRSSFFVFNGDYVDRGAWGVETYLYLLAWKIFLPDRLFLLRGNHETKFCVSNYGFEQEVKVKFASDARHVFRWFLACFESHPLAAVIAGSVYVCHGGLFRKPTQKGGEGKGDKWDKGDKGGKGGKRGKGGKGARRKKEPPVLQLGDLHDLAHVRRTVLDPTGTGLTAVPADILWSDPCPEPCPGLAPNKGRGIGLVFGPDCTQEFLVANDLKLIVRSHEGPDAREKRPEMAPMAHGYTIDHDVPAGRLITLFSAPDYPQFQARKQRYNNKAAYIVLRPPDFSTPEFTCFEAVLPRPEAKAYYDFENVADSDEELDIDCPEGSGSDMSSHESDTSNHGSESDSERT